MKAWLHAAALLVAWSCLADAALAHSIGLSRGTYRLTPQGLSAEIVFDGDELGAWAADLADRIHVSSAGEACQRSLAQVRDDTASTRTLLVNFACPLPSEALSVQLSFWDELADGHRHVVNAAAGARASRPLCFAGDPGFELAAVVARSLADTSEETRDPKAASAASPSWLDWIRYGLEHIWAGPDHLLFLFALVLGVKSFRALARITITFTLAHSLTLALAATDIITPPPSLVEPLIAVSIAIVAIENLSARRPRGLTVFGFGLIHGFGFAGALSEIGLSVSQHPGALVAFNVGVELGQLTLLALAVPLVAWLAKRPWFGQRALPCLNVAIILVSLSWSFERVSTGLPDDSDHRANLD